ncbi:MAG: hypothetical protein OXU23_17280 [Candidatus Poribacteria bacterium]|nr:hypothetical protein [Candidatus Poribacteria bacterium]
MLRKKITIGASASARSRQTSRSTSECTGDSEGRTASIAVRPRNPRPVSITFYRDEIFDVTVTVSGTPHYVGVLELELCEGKKEQTLGSRGKVKMYDFGIEEGTGQDRRLITDVTQLRFESKHKGKRTFKAVINTAQTVRIKATEVINADGDLNESLSAETDDIYIAHRLRQYTTEHGDANQYDSYIDKWVGYWDDWKLPAQTDKSKAPEHYTFMTDAVPSADFVKALTYKESTMSTALAEGENLMQVREPALIGMNTNHPKKEDDVHGEGLGDDYAGGRAGDGRQTMKYRVPTVVTIFDDSFKWGIRWLIAKRTRFNDSGAVKVRDWWDPTGAAKWYNREKGKQVSYPLSVEKLYAEGRYPHTEEGSPDYLWPIKVDKIARDDDANPPAEAGEENAEESPETPPQE